MEALEPHVFHADQVDQALRDVLPLQHHGLPRGRLERDGPGPRARVQGHERLVVRARLDDDRVAGHRALRGRANAPERFAGGQAVVLLLARGL